jgi:hypothetical protein
VGGIGASVRAELAGHGKSIWVGRGGNDVESRSGMVWVVRRGWSIWRGKASTGMSIWIDRCWLVLDSRFGLGVLWPGKEGRFGPRWSGMFRPVDLG